MAANRLILPLVTALALALPVHAQTVGDLADVQAETLFLRAKAARAEALAKLTEANREAGGATTTNTAEQAGVPVVKGVYGSGTRLYATFLYANGSSVDAMKGDRIPGDFVVRSISASRVELGHKGRTHVVGFSDIRPLAQASTRAPERAPSPADPSIAE